MEPDDINSIVQDKARLKWACRRGMLELDVLLGKFLENCYEKLPDEHKRYFVELLSCTDPELYAWLTGHETPPDEHLRTIVELIRKHVRPGI